MKRKEHLTLEGIRKIVSIKAVARSRAYYAPLVLNKGLPGYLEAAFPNIVPANRPQFTDQRIPDSN